LRNTTQQLITQNRALLALLSGKWMDGRKGEFGDAAVHLTAKYMQITKASLENAVDEGAEF
jgi:hypothetical protein